MIHEKKINKHIPKHGLQPTSDEIPKTKHLLVVTASWCAPRRHMQVPQAVPPDTRQTVADYRRKLRTKRKKIRKYGLGAPGLATRSKDATWGSWPYY